MKIRQGFVSNSSTTSFCIYGAYVSPEEDERDEDDEDYDEYEDMYEKVENAGLECHHMEGRSGEYCVGLGPNCIKDDETGGAFKLRVQKMIKDIFPSFDGECDWEEEAYYS